ncbi:MAG TPA: hypothetical protein EYN27_06170 [Rhodospirillales bacterium]|nr:hypothetical protein [Rhodospirillales bacterium]
MRLGTLSERHELVCRPVVLPFLHEGFVDSHDDVVDAGLDGEFEVVVGTVTHLICGIHKFSFIYFFRRSLPKIQTSWKNF